MAGDSLQGREIPLRSLSPGEEPDESLPRVIVLHSLSGEHRVLFQTAGGVEVSGRSRASAAGDGPHDTREKAIAAARELAHKHGLDCVYVREDV